MLFQNQKKRGVRSFQLQPHRRYLCKKRNFCKTKGKFKYYKNSRLIEEFRVFFVIFNSQECISFYFNLIFFIIFELGFLNCFHLKHLRINISHFFFIFLWDGIIRNLKLKLNYNIELFSFIIVHCQVKIILRAKVNVCLPLKKFSNLQGLFLKGKWNFTLIFSKKYIYIFKFLFWSTKMFILA